MKRLLTLTLIVNMHFPAYSQAVLLSENFDTYNGLPSSIPSGFTISWNDTSSSSKSYYFSAAYCGVACNSYKFGVDSATIITPAFSNPGSVSFYLKGNGTYKANSFKVYETPDGTIWNLVTSIDSIPSSAQTVTLPLSLTSIQLRFFYSKPILGYNAGFDDLVVYGPVGVNEKEGLSGVSVYPSPASSAVQVNFGAKSFGKVTVQLANILGMEVYRDELASASGNHTIDVSALPDGLYLLRMSSGSGEVVRRIAVRK